MQHGWGISHGFIHIYEISFLNSRTFLNMIDRLYSYQELNVNRIQLGYRQDGKTVVIVLTFSTCRFIYYTETFEFQHLNIFILFFTRYTMLLDIYNTQIRDIH